MKLPRDLNGEDLAKHLCKSWKYQRIHQVGSHMATSVSQNQATLPHKELHLPVDQSRRFDVFYGVEGIREEAQEDHGGVKRCRRDGV